MSPTHSDKTTRTLPRSETNWRTAGWRHFSMICWRTSSMSTHYGSNDTPGKRDVTTHSLKPVQRRWLKQSKQGCLCPADTIRSGRARSKRPQSTRTISLLNTHHRDSRTKRATETELGTFKAVHRWETTVHGRRQTRTVLHPKATRRMPGRVGGGVWVDGLRVG